MNLMNLVDEWQFLYWTEKQLEKDGFDDPGVKEYKGTLSQALKKFRSFLANNEYVINPIVSIDSEFKRYSDGKCFYILDYTDDEYFERFI